MCFWGCFLGEILLPSRRDAIFHFFLTGSFRLDFGPPGGVEIGMKKSKIGKIARAKIFKKSLKKVKNTPKPKSVKDKDDSKITFLGSETGWTQDFLRSKVYVGNNKNNDQTVNKTKT